MEKITQDQYYSDNTHVSHSMLCDFVTYNKHGDRITLPEFYYAKHILGNNLFEKTDAMMVGSIVDEYISVTAKANRIEMEADKLLREVDKGRQEFICYACEKIIDDTRHYTKQEQKQKDADIEAFYKEEEFDSITDKEKNIISKMLESYYASSRVQHFFSNYPTVAKRSGNNPNEITKSMSETIGKMISALESFKTLNYFISLPDTKTGQDDETILQKSIELPDGTLNLKGKVDFINHTKKQIVDLKTTGSVEMVLDGLMYKGTPMLHARYIRQLAYYRYLASPDMDYTCDLAVADGDGRIVWIPIRKDILDRAWELIKDDLAELSYHYATNFTELIKDPFKEFAEEKADELTL